MINDGAINNNATIDALNDVNTTLTNNINNVNTTLTNNINNVNTTLTNNINNVNTTLTNSIDDVNTTLTNSIDDVETTLTNNINNVNTTLTNSINTKQATITGGATTITSSNLTANRALIANGSGKVAVSSVTSTELGYLDGVTSALQTQINNRITASISKNQNGYCKLNNGLIIQWFRVNSGAYITTSFPTAFTSADSYAVSSAMYAPSNTDTHGLNITEKTATNIKTYLNSGYSFAYVTAIGY